MRTIHTLGPVLTEVAKLPVTGLVVLDIDETILHSGEGVGSETWYDERIKANLAAGMDTAAAVLESNDAWEKEQPGLAVFLTEPILLTLLQLAEKQGVHTLGLTARRPEMAEATKTQFSRIGVELTASRWWNKNVVVSELASYIDGVLYGGPLVDKGSALFNFFTKVGAVPTSIVFVDDKQYHLQSMEKLCAENQIPSACFHYLRPTGK